MNLFELVGNVTLRTAEALSGLNSVENSATRVGGVFTSMGEKVAAAGKAMSLLVTVPIVAALGYSIKAASDLNETVSKTSVVFKENAGDIMSWSKTTLKSIGLSQLSALDMAATFGDMGTSMGLSNNKAAEMSKGLVNLTGDMASFKNIKPAEVHTALTSVYTGETESLKRLGIVMTEANLIQFAKTEGVKKSYKEMTQAEKVQLRYDYVVAMSKNSMGDFQRTQSSAANQMRIFTEGVKEGATKIGALLLPTFVKFINLANQVLDKFMKMTPSQQAFILKLALVAGAIGPVLIVLGTLAGALGAIITFFGTIGLTTSLVIVAIVGLGVALGAFSIKTMGVKGVLSALVDIFKSVKKEAQEFFTLLAAGAPPIQLIMYRIASLIGIKTELGKAIIKVRDGFNDMVTGVKTYVTQLWKTVNTVFNDIKTVLEPFFQKIKDKVLPQVMGMVSELEKLFGAIYTKVAEVLAFITPIWSGFWVWFKPFAEQVLNGLVITLTFVFTTIKNVFKLARQVITGDWSGAWDTIKSLLAGAVTFILDQAMNMYSGFIATIKRLASNALSGLRGMKNDMVDTILGLGTSLYNAGVNAMDMLWKGLKSKLGAIKDIASQAAKAIGSFLGFKSPTKEGEGKDADKWMPNLMNMLIDGIKNNKGKLAAAAADVSKMLKFEGTSDMSYKASVGNSMNAGLKNVVLQINNPKIFDTKDIDKFMNPVVTRLRKLGVGLK